MKLNFYVKDGLYHYDYYNEKGKIVQQDLINKDNKTCTTKYENGKMIYQKDFNNCEKWFDGNGCLLSFTLNGKEYCL